jgi:hypothetical protein
MSPRWFRFALAPTVAVLCGIALACGAAGGGGTAGGRGAARPDILLLVVDGLRADEADRWIEGAGLEEWLAGDGVRRFSRAYAPSSIGVQSLAALFAGRLPTHGGGIGLSEAQPSERADTLATLLRRAGYRTGFVSHAAWAARPGFARGFDDLQVAPPAGWSAAQVTARALQVLDDWLQSAEPGDARPWLLVVHWAAPPVAEGASTVPGEDEALAQAGAALAELRHGLAQRDALRDAVVALTAGHGTERGEHGGAGAGWTLHEEVIRVPLVVRGLGGSGTIATPVSTLALGATLRELVATAREGVVEDGAETPVASLPRAEGTGSSSVRAVISELVVRERAIARAVIDGDLKYLRILREVPLADRPVVARGYEELQAAMVSGQVPTPPLFGEPVRELLVRVGPGDVVETELALVDHREELSRLRAELREYRRLCEEDGWAPPEITERLPVDREDVESLEMLGYL